MIWCLRKYLEFLSIFSIKKASLAAFHIFSTPIRKARNEQPIIFSQASPVSFVVDGIKIKGYAWLNNHAKKALIVHGFESRAYNFEKYIQPLIDLGYNVYAMDAKAHGLSEGKTIVLPEYLAMLAKLEDTVGKFDVYLGHSFGGLALSLYLEKHPNEHAKMILIAPATETSTAIDMFCKFLHLNASMKAEIHRLILEKSGVPVEHFSIKRALPHILCKILWIHDLHDDITPYSDAKPIFDSKPSNVTIITTKELGHRRIYRDTDVLKQVFEYINNQP